MKTSFFIVSFIIAIVANALANILMRAGSERIHDTGIHTQSPDFMALIKAYIFNWKIIVGVALFGLALVFYNLVLSRPTPLSIAYPIMTTGGFVLVILAGSLFFGEWRLLLEWQSWLGISLILAGVWLLASRLSQSN